MRGKKAKEIRKLAYEEMALKSEEVRKQKSFLMKIIDTLKRGTDGKRVLIHHHTVRNTGLRDKYQRIKKAYKGLNRLQRHNWWVK